MLLAKGLRTEDLEHVLPFFGRILLRLELFEPLLRLFIIDHHGEARGD